MDRKLTKRLCKKDKAAILATALVELRYNISGVNESRGKGKEMGKEGGGMATYAIYVHPGCEETWGR